MNSVVKRSVIWSASPTPFTAAGDLDHASLERLIERHVQLGVAGVFLGGTSGEGPFMPDGQRLELAAAVVKLARGRFQVTAQVSDTSAARVKENMARLAGTGINAVVIAPPFIISEGLCSPAFLRRYFLEPIEAAALPVGVYIRPPVGSVKPAAALWEELARHPKVKFVKDSSSSAEQARQLVALRQNHRPADLSLMTGDEFDVLSAVEAGYDGCLMGTAVLNARLIRRALEALQAGRRDEANQWQQRSNDFLRELFRPDISGWMGGLKYALCRLGVFASEFAHLTYPQTDADRRRIDAALDREREFL